MFFKSLWNFWADKPPADQPVNSPEPNRLRWGIVSITGNFRENNEDRYAVHPSGRYFIVCDGMGGQSAGEKASELASELVPQRLDQLLDFRVDDPEKVGTAIDDAVARANSEIMALGEIDPHYHSMGTTIAMMVEVSNSLYVAGVGDSRVYRLQGDELQQLTKDHSLSGALLDAGTITKEEAAVHRYKHVLVRYLGTKEGGTGTQAQQVPLEPGDRYVLCSDGVTDGVNDAQLQELLRSASEPQPAAEAIVAAAQQGGSRDNITCIVVFVD